MGAVGRVLLHARRAPDVGNFAELVAETTRKEADLIMLNHILGADESG